MHFDPLPIPVYEDDEQPWDHPLPHLPLAPLDVCNPSNFDFEYSGAQYFEPQAHRRYPSTRRLFQGRYGTWDEEAYEYCLYELWRSHSPLTFEIRQINEACVPHHLFDYRKSLTWQIELLATVPREARTLDYFATLVLLLSERKSLQYLVKEFYRCCWNYGEPPRNEEEKRVGFRFGDLVHGKSEDHWIHNWPCYVVANTKVEGQDVIWVRKSNHQPNRCCTGGGNALRFPSVTSVLVNEYEGYLAADLARLPPILAEANGPYRLFRYEGGPEFDEFNEPEDNFRRYFPNATTFRSRR